MPGVVVEPAIQVLVEIAQPRVPVGAGVRAGGWTGRAGVGLGMIQVLSAREQVGMRPQCVAAFQTTGFGHGDPQCGGLAQPAGAQLQTDEGGEGLLGWAARGPSTADRLVQRDGVGERTGCRRVDDRVDPTLDEGQCGLEPTERCGLSGSGFELEHA